MTLWDVLLELREHDPSAAIYAERPVTLACASLVRQVGDEGDPPEDVEGLRFLMEVWHATDAFEGVRQVLREEQGQIPSTDAMLDRFIEYLKNDA